MQDNEKSRKYQLTINNPLEKGCDHAEINKRMEDIKYLYYCLCDETGEQGTPHTHIYFVCENAMFFSRVKKLFPEAHIEAARGLNCENRDYIRKEGKYADSEKKETNHIETFEEYGEMPLDKSAKNRTISNDIVNMIKKGCTNTDIISKYPSCYNKIQHIEKTRQEFKKEKYSESIRLLETAYIYGAPGTGKTRSVMDEYGYKNVYRVTDYKHPFDNYKGEDIVLFDEFNGQIEFESLLNYLDIYPLTLPCRYSDKTACYTKVFIISNIPLEEQYQYIQITRPQQWNALIRRINRISEYSKNGEIIEYFPSQYCIQEVQNV